MKYYYTTDGCYIYNWDNLRCSDCSPLGEKLLWNRTGKWWLSWTVTNVLLGCKRSVSFLDSALRNMKVMPKIFCIKFNSLYCHFLILPGSTKILSTEIYVTCCLATETSSVSMEAHVINIWNGSNIYSLPGPIELMTCICYEKKLQAIALIHDPQRKVAVIL